MDFPFIVRWKGTTHGSSLALPAVNISLLFSQSSSLSLSLSLSSSSSSLSSSLCCCVSAVRCIRSALVFLNPSPGPRSNLTLVTIKKNHSRTWKSLVCVCLSLSLSLSFSLSPFCRCICSKSRAWPAVCEILWFTCVICRFAYSSEAQRGKLTYTHTHIHFSVCVCMCVSGVPMAFFTFTYRLSHPSRKLVTQAHKLSLSHTLAHQLSPLAAWGSNRV